MANNINPGQLSFLQNILEFSTQHTDTSNVNESPKARELSPERKEFLEDVLKAKSVNPTDEMKKCIVCLNNENEGEDRKLEALETLRDWCEDINFAADFHKIDQYNLIPLIVNDKNEEIRALAFDFIGTLAQNNEYSQKTLIEFNILPIIFDKLENDASDNVRIKSLYSLSCILREFNDGQEAFLKNNGCEVLVRTVQVPIQKLIIKSCFLITSICNNLALKNEFTKQSLIEKLINIYSQTQLNVHEYVLSAITSLIDNNPVAIKQAKNMNLNFKNMITQRLQIINNDASQLEEKENATCLLNTLFKN